MKSRLKREHQARRHSGAVNLARRFNAGNGTTPQLRVASATGEERDALAILKRR
jgi:hypothetical protein